MEIIEDVGDKKNNERIEKALKKFGYAPEHLLNWFRIYSNEKEKRYFAFWPDGTALFLNKDGKEWVIFSEPIAPADLGGKRVAEFAKFALKDPKIKKVWVEAETKTQERILKNLPENLRANNPSYSLVWPIMNLEKFDPSLPGKHFKSLRNAKNKFYKEHKVAIVDAKKMDKELLHDVVRRWAENRKHRDRAYTQEYHSIIDSGFNSAQTARAMIVDGKVVGFNAGWPMPNLKRWSENMGVKYNPKDKRFYAALGILDYSAQDLGLALYLEDFDWMKNAGYKTADMAGVEEGGPLNFKKQFLPESYYKTSVFSIVRKEKA